MSSTDNSASHQQPARQSSDLAILQRLLEANRNVAIAVERSGRIVAANKAANFIFGRGGALMHRRLSEVIRDLQLHEAYGQALDRGFPAEAKMDIIGPGKRSFDIFVSPIELDGDRHAIGVFYDVTQVERLEKIRQEFLSNISHELRTPLTSILAFVETLEDGAIDDNDNNRRFLGVIRRNAERMHELIADILELSMIESGNVSIQTKTVRPRNLVDEVFTALSSKAVTREIRLINEIDPQITATADPVRLEQMLTNLVDNAIKFNRRAGSVTISAAGTSEKTSISVTDTGEGILSGHLSRVFERFYRADRGRSREVGGTGLGLAIVKHLARLHGGEVSVTSVPGQGTTFTIQLPV